MDTIEITDYRTRRTCLGLKISTKNKLDRLREPGQSYDKFICQLLDSWKGAKRSAIYQAGSAEGKPGC